MAATGETIGDTYAVAALTLLRRAAEHGHVRAAISKSEQNRPFAALMANLALAEDLVARPNDGRSSASARKARVVCRCSGGRHPSPE